MEDLIRNKSPGNKDKDRTVKINKLGWDRVGWTCSGEPDGLGAGCLRLSQKGYFTPSGLCITHFNTKIQRMYGGNVSRRQNRLLGGSLPGAGGKFRRARQREARHRYLYTISGMQFLGFMRR
jgi:hypothetical protein